jgi:hypothetical protein
LFDYEGISWGLRTPFPDANQEAIVDSILKKWSKGVFFAPNPTLRLSFKLVDLAAALLHLDDWEVEDRDKGLTDEEMHLVRTNNKWFSSVAEILFRKPRGCAKCQKLWEPGVNLKKCSGCQQVFYCNRDCQRADWKPKHRVQCKYLRGRLDKDVTYTCSFRNTLSENDDFMCMDNDSGLAWEIMKHRYSK